MKKSEKLLARRNAIVPEGMGMFSPLTIASAKGAITKDVDGKEYIDFAGGIGVLNAGHCPKPVVDAIIKQSKQLIHACFPVAIYEPYVELCEVLAKLFPHGKSTKVMLTSTDAESGESITINPKGQSLAYTGFLRSNVPVDHVDVIWNGEVVATHSLKGPTKSVDFKGTIKVKGSGWVLLRAWSDQGHPDLLDLYPYASTNPIYIQASEKNLQQQISAAYFLKWVTRIEDKINELTFRSEAEKQLVLKDIQQAKSFYQNLVNK